MSKTINGTTTQFLYGGLNPIQDLSGGPSPTVQANMMAGLDVDEYLVRSDSNGIASYLDDAVGSTLGLVYSGGTIGTSYTYQPFGATTAAGTATTNSYHFTGREDDGDGLYFHRARYYNPTFQRFISQDPIEFAGGDANLYGYSSEDPINRFDPLGLAEFAYRRLEFGDSTSAEAGSYAALGASVLANPAAAAVGSLAGPLPGNDTLAMHEVVIFDKPQDLSFVSSELGTSVSGVGFSDTNNGFIGPGRLEPERNMKKFVYFKSGHHYDDAPIVQALREVDSQGLGTYCLIGNNCQDFMAKLRNQYDRDQRQRASSSCGR